jgi:hypothetical protein
VRPHLAGGPLGGILVANVKLREQLALAH